MCAQGWKQPDDPLGRNDPLGRAVQEYGETFGEPSTFKEMSIMWKALGVSLDGERIAQHALISAVLAAETLVTGSLPAAMLTQVLFFG